MNRDTTAFNPVVIKYTNLMIYFLKAEIVKPKISIVGVNMRFSGEKFELKVTTTVSDRLYEAKDIINLTNGRKQHNEKGEGETTP